MSRLFEIMEHRKYKSQIISTINLELKISVILFTKLFNSHTLSFVSSLFAGKCVCIATIDFAQNYDDEMI